MHLCSQFSFPRTVLTNFAVSPHPHHHSFFQAVFSVLFCREKICLLLCWQKGTLCPHIYKSSFMCLQQVEICCHMNLWHRAIRKAGKVNKEDLHYHKPWYLKSIHQKLPASFVINHSSDSSQWRLSWRQGLCNGQKLLMWKGAELPYFCLFPVGLEQLSAAKRPKTWAKLPCPSLFLTSFSYNSLLLLSGYSFCLSICFGLDSSAPKHTDCSASPFYSPSAAGTACPTHDQVGPNQRYTNSVLCFHMASNYAASRWKHNSKYNFGSISSEGISFSDCLPTVRLCFTGCFALLEGISCLLSI